MELVVSDTESNAELGADEAIAVLVTCSEAELELCSVLVKALLIAIDIRVEEVLACVDTP